MTDLYYIGADPVDLNAAKMLWGSPWWAKVLESMDDYTPDENTFVTILVRIYRDCVRQRARGITLQEFADLASMARKVRWKNVKPNSFGHRVRGQMKKRLGYLRWNTDTARFEFDVRFTDRFRDPEGQHGKRWKKMHKAERALERVGREKRVSEMLQESLQT